MQAKQEQAWWASADGDAVVTEVISMAFSLIPWTSCRSAACNPSPLLIEDPPPPSPLVPHTPTPRPPPLSRSPLPRSCLLQTSNASIIPYISAVSAWLLCSCIVGVLSAAAHIQLPVPSLKPLHLLYLPSLNVYKFVLFNEYALLSCCTVLPSASQTLYQSVGIQIIQTFGYSGFLP